MIAAAIIGLTIIGVSLALIICILIFDLEQAHQQKAYAEYGRNLALSMLDLAKQHQFLKLLGEYETVSKPGRAKKEGPHVN